MGNGKKARLLTMDELCARPCEVGGVQVLFHRWVEEDRVLIRFDRLCAPGDANVALRRFHSESILPAGCSTEVIRETFALVEYRDGTIGKVKPEDVRFLDKEG